MVYRLVLIFSFKKNEYTGPSPVKKIAKLKDKKFLTYLKNNFLFITIKANK